MLTCVWVEVAGAGRSQIERTQTNSVVSRAIPNVWFEDIKDLKFTNRCNPALTWSRRVSPRLVVFKMQPHFKALDQRVCVCVCVFVCFCVSNDHGDCGTNWRVLQELKELQGYQARSFARRHRITRVSHLSLKGRACISEETSITNTSCSILLLIVAAFQKRKVNLMTPSFFFFFFFFFFPSLPPTTRHDTNGDVVASRLYTFFAGMSAALTASPAKANNNTTTTNNNNNNQRKNQTPPKTKPKTKKQNTHIRMRDASIDARKRNRDAALPPLRSNQPCHCFFHSALLERTFVFPKRPPCLEPPVLNISHGLLACQSHDTHQPRAYDQRRTRKRKGRRGEGEREEEQEVCEPEHNTQSDVHAGRANTPARRYSRPAHAIMRPLSVQRAMGGNSGTMPCH